MLKLFNKLCLPAQVYIVIAILVCVVALFSKAPVGPVIFKLVFALIWTWILNWICKKGFVWLSWLLVLIPYIIVLLVVFKIVKTTKQNKK